MSLDAAAARRTPRLRFDRHELAGAFGDIGTDLPLLVGLITISGLDATSVCLVFGGLQILTGLVYGIPMPIQPLKAMAAIMLAERLAPGVLAGGGLVIGVAMLALSITGALDWIARVVPHAVVRGLQLGLGLSLARIALGSYVGSQGLAGYLLAAVALIALLALRRQHRVPGPLVVIGLGAVYALLVTPELRALDGGVFGLGVPKPVIPTPSELWIGAVMLALPQIPLSLGNSVLATSQATRDLFPGRAVGVRRIGFTYGLINLIGPVLGGTPACHGCGGLVGFHAFGARTGGAPVLYGLLYVTLGLLFAPGFAALVKVFPMPVLGVVLLIESLALMLLVRDVAADATGLWIALVVAAAVIGLPYGYVVGLLVGTLLAWTAKRDLLRLPGSGD